MLQNVNYAPYSYSKIEVYNKCPKAFEYQYIQKLPRNKKPQLHFDKGTFIHLLMEHNGNLDVIKNTKEFNEIKEHGILTKEHFKEYFKTYKKFTETGIGKQILKRKEIYKELPIGITFDYKKTLYKDPKALLRGFIDAVYVDEEKDVLLLVDWKTGRYVPKEKQSWLQLMIYSISLFDIVPFDTILIMYAYIEDNKINTKVLHRKDIPKYQKALETSIQKIEETEVFEKNETALCPWCDFYEVCQGLDTQDL